MNMNSERRAIKSAKQKYIAKLKKLTNKRVKVG